MKLSVQVKIPITLTGNPEFRDELRIGGAEALAYYHRYHLYRHFKPDNAQRYNHAPRNASYVIKRTNYGRKMGHQTCDMVLTQRLKNAMMGKTPRPNYYGSNQHIVNVTSDYDFPHPVSMQIIEELARKTPSEVQGMQKRVTDRIDNYYRKNGLL